MQLAECSGRVQLVALLAAGFTDLRTMPTRGSEGNDGRADREVWLRAKKKGSAIEEEQLKQDFAGVVMMKTAAVKGWL